MMTAKELEEYILALPGSWLDFPFGEEPAVYKIGKAEDGEGKMFALVTYNTKPIRISLKCDPLLSKTLRELYETVMPGYHLNKKHWNTVLYTGQLPDEEIKSLIHISYDLVKNSK
jgi:predicted DNA-binding protein (MmcQ/YjbR family)